VAAVPWTVVVSDEGVAFSNELAAARFPWALITRAMENRHVYLLCDANGPMVAIPKRFVASDENRNLLREILRQRGLIS
jgi:hypothetical protein